MNIDVKEAIDWFRATREHYETAKDYYEGVIPERFSSDRLRRTIGKQIVNPSLNFAAIPVKAVLNRLEIASITGDDDRAQDVINEIWEYNDLEIESNDVHHWSLVFGDGYLMVWPEPEFDTFTINYNSPLNTVVFYDKENPRKKRFAAKMWMNEDGKVRLNLYYTDEVHKFISKKKTSNAEWKEFDYFVDEDTDELGVMPSPFDFIPVFHMRTSRPIGTPEHVNAYGPQDMITKNIVSQLVANDYHGLPQRYIISETPEDVFNLSDTADVDQAKLSAGAGEVWWLENVKAVGQFDAAEPNDYLAPFREYVKAMGTLTETPMYLFEGGSQVPSGESLKVAEAPLVKKVRTRQHQFGSVWRELFLELFDFLGVNSSVSVNWEAAESESASAMWDNVKKAVDTGLTLEEALRYVSSLDESVIDRIMEGRNAEI